MGQASSQAAPGPLGRSQGCPFEQDYGVDCEQSLNTKVNCPEPQVLGLARDQGDPGEDKPYRHRDLLQGRATPVIPMSRNFMGPLLLVLGDPSPHGQQDTKRPGSSLPGSQCHHAPALWPLISPSHPPQSATKSAWGHLASTAGHPSTSRPCEASHGSSIHCGLLPCPPEYFLWLWYTLL